jgi:hypothetical protein
MLDQSKRKAIKYIWGFLGLGTPGARDSNLIDLKL